MSIVTSNVTSYLQSVFHPEWTYTSVSGFQLQLNTSLDGNVTIGNSNTNYTFELNGQVISASGQGVSSLNGLQGALTISTTTTTNISIYTSGQNIFVDFSGAGGSVVDVSDWANYRAVSNVDLCGNYLLDSTGSVNVCGHLLVTNGLSVNGNITSASGNLVLTEGNVVLTSGNIVATGGSITSNFNVGNMLSLTRSANTLCHSVIYGYFDLAQVRINYGISPSGATDVTYGTGFSVITFNQPFLNNQYMITFGDAVTSTTTLSLANARLITNLKNNGSCAIIMDSNGLQTHYMAIGLAP